MHKLLESQTVEFKQIWKDEYLKTICAFANSEGGILYIGLNDDAEILGVENIEELIELLPNKINNRLGLVVDIILKNANKKHILYVNYPDSILLKSSWHRAPFFWSTNESTQKINFYANDQENY